MKTHKSLIAAAALSLIPAIATAETITTDNLQFNNPAITKTTESVPVEEVIKLERGNDPNARFHYSLRTGLGYVNGEINEYVYLPEVGNYKLSQLKWDIDNLLMGNIGASFSFEKWLTINADAWFKLTEGNGAVNDHDWFYEGYDWSHWSRSETDITSASIIDINANVALFRHTNTVITGIVGFKRDNFEFKANGGEYIYSSGYGYRDLSGTFPSVPGLGYDQTLTSGYVGLGFSANFTDNLQLSGRGIYSPIVRARATDHHYMRNLVTKDSGGNDGTMYAFDLTLAWFFSQHFSWDVSGQYQEYDKMQDDSTYYFNDAGDVITFNNSAGMDQKLSMFATHLTYTF